MRGDERKTLHQFVCSHQSEHADLSVEAIEEMFGSVSSAKLDKKIATALTKSRNIVTPNFA